MKSKKTLFLCIAMTFIMSMPMSQVRASETDNSLSSSSEINVTEGETVLTQSVDDETGLANSGLPSRLSARQTSGVIYETSEWYGPSYLVQRATATGDSKVSKEFVKYLTASWAKAASYVWSESNTTNWTYGGNVTGDVHEKVRIQLQLSKSRTTTYSVGINIPANNTYYSKLGFASDYFVQNFKWEKIVDGLTTDSATGYIKTPTVDTYLIVYYQ